MTWPWIYSMSAAALAKKHLRHLQKEMTVDFLMYFFVQLSAETLRLFPPNAILSFDLWWLHKEAGVVKNNCIKQSNGSLTERPQWLFKPMEKLCFLALLPRSGSKQITICSSWSIRWSQDWRDWKRNRHKASVSNLMNWVSKCKQNWLDYCKAWQMRENKYATDKGTYPLYEAVLRAHGSIV